ncbi:MAG TPA: MFS transporter [Stellaceae bacterium]|nr:MFS transporter [Stellaceae bacterium]
MNRALRMRARVRLRLVLIGLGASVVPLDTAVNIAFPDITRGFHLPIAMIQWVVIAYVLTYASLMLAFGRAGDLFGHGRVFRLGLGWSGAAFLMCAAAPSYGLLLFFRFLQGVGAGLVISCAPALVIALYPEEERSRALGVFTMIFALGSALGPLLGGALAARWGWPAVFWFRAPVALVPLVLLGRLPAAARAGMAEPLDVPGAVFLALAISAVLLFLNQHEAALRTAFAVAAALGIFAFIRRERRIAAPIVNLDFFRHAGFAITNLANVAVNLAGFSVLLFGAYYLVRFTRLPLPAAGAVLAAAFVGMTAASPVAGWLVARIGTGRVASLGAALSAAGLFFVGLWNPAFPHQTITIVLTLILQGFGLGLFQVAYMETVMRILPAGQRGVAGSLTMLTRTIGIVGGASVLTLLFHTFEAAAGGSGADAAFLAAFHGTFRLAAAASAVVAIIAALQKDRG